MQRRALLSGMSALIGAGLAGCLGDSGGEVYEVRGVEVPLVPVAEAIDWHEAGEAVFLDARSRSEYEELHIEGAEHSPEPDGLAEGDPTEDLDTDTRIVTYCVCPHVQAGSRAASLMEEGYTDVQALDEGLEEWYEQGYPVAGNGELVEPQYHE